MKIAILSPPWIALPPSGYGGIEQIVFHLSEGLHRRGHDVFVYATGDSQISSHLRFFYQQSLGVDTLLEKSYVFYFLNHLFYAIKNLPHDIDIIHNHCEAAAMHLLDMSGKLSVHTLHGPLPQKKDFLDDRGNTVKYSLRANYEIFNFFAAANYISISNFQRQSMPGLNFVATVYNSINLPDFAFQAGSASEEMVWLGRFSPQKGLDIAVKLARATHRKLKIAAKIHEQRQDIFQKEIMPFVDGQLVTFIGEIKAKEKQDFLSKSKLFLMPIQWEEPFGLVIVESMACGTPVVAFARGSVPEVIKDGETGFIVNPSDTDIRGNWIIKKTGLEGLCEAVEKIYSMPEEKYRVMRRACRAHVEQNFTVEKMVDNYERVYEEILSKKKGL